MANWGNGIMVVRGNNKKNIENFMKCFDYENEKYFAKQEVYNVEIEETLSGDFRAEIEFGAGWSLNSSFLDNESSYYRQWKNNPNMFLTNAKLTCLEIECKELDLECEAWFEEEGCEFQEHIFVNKKGELEIEDSCEWSREYWDYDEEDGMSENELQAKYGDNDDIEVGGFENYGEFKI